VHAEQIATGNLFRFTTFQHSGSMAEPKPAATGGHGHLRHLLAILTEQAFYGSGLHSLSATCTINFWPIIIGVIVIALRLSAELRQRGRPSGERQGKARQESQVTRMEISMGSFFTTSYGFLHYTA